MKLFEGAHATHRACALHFTLLVPAEVSRHFVALSFLTGSDLFGADRVVLPHRERTADDHEESDNEHALAKTGTVALTLIHNVAFRILFEDVPLNSKAIEADHAVQFRNDQEDERVEQAVVVGVHADQVGVEASRIRQHADEVREDEKEEQEGRDEPCGREP